MSLGRLILQSSLNIALDNFPKIFRVLGTPDAIIVSWVLLDAMCGFR